jgi:hypothetical protein
MWIGHAGIVKLVRWVALGLLLAIASITYFAGCGMMIGGSLGARGSDPQEMEQIGAAAGALIGAGVGAFIALVVAIWLAIRHWLDRPRSTPATPRSA